MQAGNVLADGSAVSLADLDKRLAETRKASGVVWYYRENGQSEPTGRFREKIGRVLDLIMNHNLPVTLSTKPDFSDYVDENGQSQPRW